MLEKAYRIAKQAHWGQKDKGGKDYIEHPLTVMKLVEYENETIIVALLHDVVEDSNVDLDYLKSEGFSKAVIFAVDCITRRRGESYDGYLKRLVQSDVAVAVKIADMTHNSDITRIPNPTQKDLDRCDKYKTKIEYLKSRNK